MNQLKRITALLLMAAITLSLCACGNSNAPAQTTSQAAPAGETEQTKEPASETAAPGAETAVQETETAAKAEGTKIIIDGYGEEVEVPETIDSIVATMWPVPSVIYTVTGSSDSIKTMAEGSMEAYLISMFQVLSPGLEDLPTNCLDSATNITFEELAKVHPDVVLCNQAVADELGDQIRAIQAVPVRFKFGEFEDVQELIRIIGELFDCQERADELIAFQKDTLSYLEAKKADHPAQENKPKVLYLVRGADSDGYQVVCPKHLNSKEIDLAGGVNAAAELTEEGTTARVSMEQIMAWNPDIILLSNFDDFTPEDFCKDEHEAEWQNVNAVKNNRVYKTPIGMYRWDTQCVEAPLMVKWMGKIINPEVYTEYDFQEDLKDFYATYMGYTLTEDDLEMILSSKANIYLDLNDEIYGKSE